MGVSGNWGEDIHQKDKGIMPDLGGSNDNAYSITQSAISEGIIEVRNDSDKDLSKLSRDPESANVPLKPIFDRDKVLEKQQAKDSFSEIAFDTVRGLAKQWGWDPSDPRIAALHAIVAGAAAEIGGGQFGDGMTVRAINKLVFMKLATSGEFSASELRWISVSLGLALDSTEGAGIADSATRNNGLIGFFKPNDLRLNPEAPKDFFEALWESSHERDLFLLFCSEEQKQTITDYMNSRGGKIDSYEDVAWLYQYVYNNTDYKNTLSSNKVFSEQKHIVVNFNFQLADLYDKYNGMILIGGMGGAGTNTYAVFGSDVKSAEKLIREIGQRGWQTTEVVETILNPYATRVSKNLATGNSATVYCTKEGAYVIVDNVTKAIVQVGEKLNPASFLPDRNIVNPFMPWLK